MGSHDRDVYVKGEVGKYYVKFITKKKKTREKNLSGSRLEDIFGGIGRKYITIYIYMYLRIILILVLGVCLTNIVYLINKLRGKQISEEITK